VQKISESQASEKVKDNELFAQMKLQMVYAHVRYLGFFLSKTIIEKHTFHDKNIKTILLDLIKIVGLKSLSEDCGSVYASGFFSPKGFDNTREALDQLIKKMRPNLVPLVESFA